MKPGHTYIREHDRAGSSEFRRQEQAMQVLYGACTNFSVKAISSST
ncbi:MAG: hypothetical protein ABIF10_03880 [Candidatus Woesearchaeota archaeon]